MSICYILSCISHLLLHANKKVIFCFRLLYLLIFKGLKLHELENVMRGEDVKRSCSKERREYPALRLKIAQIPVFLWTMCLCFYPTT